jgi:hypothetical protein
MINHGLVTSMRMCIEQVHERAKRERSRSRSPRGYRGHAVAATSHAPAVCFPQASPVSGARGAPPVDMGLFPQQIPASAAGAGHSSRVVYSFGDPGMYLPDPEAATPTPAGAQRSQKSNLVSGVAPGGHAVEGGEGEDLEQQDQLSLLQVVKAVLHGRGQFIRGAACSELLMARSASPPKVPCHAEQRSLQGATCTMQIVSWSLLLQSSLLACQLFLQRQHRSGTRLPIS